MVRQNICLAKVSAVRYFTDFWRIRLQLGVHIIIKRQSALKLLNLVKNPPPKKKQNKTTTLNYMSCTTPKDESGDGTTLVTDVLVTEKVLIKEPTSNGSLSSGCIT